MIDLDETNIDDEVFDGEAALREAGDTASDNAQMRELAQFQRENTDPEPKSDVARLAERMAPTPAPTPAPAPQGLSLDVVERMIERVVEKVTPRQEAAPTVPIPPPEPTLVEQFDRDDGFYREAMKQAGYTADDKGNFTREAMTAVRAHLRLADQERSFEQKIGAMEAQRQQSELLSTARSIEARLGAFEPLSSMQQRSFARAVGELLQLGHDLPSATETVVREFGPMLRPRAAPAPVVPGRQLTRRAPTAADRIVATPGMAQAGRAPPASPEDRLAAARRSMAERLTTKRR